MDRRKAKRLAQTLEKQIRSDERLEAVRARILDGDKIADLRQHFNERVLKSSFGAFSTNEYSLIEKAIGPAASEYKFLIDECVDAELLNHSHKNLGVTKLSSLFFAKSVQDRELYKVAQESGFDAILSCDYVPSGNKALCGIAKSTTDDQYTPMVILLPQKLDDSIHAVEQHKSRILVALESKIRAPVYDARIC